MRQAEEEARGVEIAGAGGVDHPRHRRRRDRVHGLGGDDDRALLAARQRGDRRNGRARRAPPRRNPSVS